MGRHVAGVDHVQRGQVGRHARLEPGRPQRNCHAALAVDAENRPVLR